MSGLHSVPKLFFGGVPTEPQVKILMEKFAKHGPGDTVSYAEAAAAVSLEERSSRFNTVLNAWRKRLRKERNIVTRRIAGERTLRFLRDEERAADAFGDGRRHIKGLVRAHHKAVDIPVERLDEPQRHTAEHTRRILGVIADDARAAGNRLAMTFATPKQLPRVQ